MNAFDRALAITLAHEGGVSNHAADRGGLTKWENIAVACLPCNQKKGDRTPQEARMTLRVQPVRPKTVSGMQMAGRWSEGMPESWKDFLRGAHYWTDSLES